MFTALEDNSAKYLFLRTLYFSSLDLHMALVGDHFREMLPIVYTPTVGHAIKNYCDLVPAKDDKGIVLTYFPPKEKWVDNHECTKNYMAMMVEKLKDEFYPGNTKKVLIVTDSTAILGIGD